ncbi:MAG: hypothetical protein A2887_03655 [Alphaproteobacteria bacterium RIFCSPLOWO2_01_FULL_40_26]|nr:MAG: hypothetical protein A3D15_04810 [Alphaproteobacteria bacterium RIFCSPHIGHO2_02_FULL_40_34]OFW88201.1 MAG: hypothetical protein A2794_05145 [Alphaproteobacteria bacterium RIFCSPHIGHO2_01_FULL_40_8]OFW95293.1 MAG: hypothetical protein A2887_03655 [Alphaproteobacteria bacterium RIFCSPLOWO2_01_FULL_40_26]OFX09196.1 MAG: hypothetical protein A3H30_06360 [Alphaproteobacteria bacterium RIFCSPLOWO2_02_FULL_40_19]OFX11552.1 MAG: hypothetical protein A3G22_04965 [Alphaproteobacteria bacterium RI
MVSIPSNKIALIAIFCIALSCPLFAAEENKTPQTLEEINADLQAKKAELEPFDPTKVKVDLESLGLDDVDKKQQEETKADPEEKRATETKTDETKEVVKETEIEESKPQTEQPVKPQEIEKPENAQPQQTPVTSSSDIKKPTTAYINSQKKKNLKKRLEAEKRRKWNEKQQKEKLQKLNELREKYLSDAEKLNEDFDSNDEDFSFSKIIIPQKKDLNPFLDEEPPALPILNRYRSKDNVHIPIILTPKERIGILFNAISIGSVRTFNEAYKDIENPNVRNAEGDTILTYALLLKKYPVIASALAKGADPNMPNKLGYTPINIAIELLDFKSLELLANNKADLNYTDAFGRTYLMHAARVGFLPAVDLFVSRLVDINAMDDDGFTALAIAYRHKKEVIVQYLLKHGAATWVEKPYKPKNQSLIKELENRWK